MSKSYNNIIPLLADEKDLRKSVMKIVTNSQEPGEKKDWKDNTLFSIYSSFASEGNQKEMKDMFSDGIGWGDAKQKVFEELNQILTPIREKYLELNSNRIRKINKHVLEKLISVKTLMMANNFIEIIFSFKTKLNRSFSIKISSPSRNYFLYCRIRLIFD